jgi:hypothetical protein
MYLHWNRLDCNEPIFIIDEAASINRTKASLTQLLINDNELLYFFCCPIAHYRFCAAPFFCNK